jgi:DNA polymerase V
MLSDRRFVLVDGNNFYVSCERLFRPALRHRPVVVLSNNDGCCVARSNEAKAMGIQMGTPYFQIRKAFEKAGGIALSSNYTLYADLSTRMMSVIGQYSDRQEIYSIDESFLEWEGFRHFDAGKMAIDLRQKVERWVGIPVGVGIGETKTLAKLANRLAKKHPDFKAQGYCNLPGLDPLERQRYLAETPIGEVWGIGRRWSQKLETLGIRTALDLSRADPSRIRSTFNVILERTALELRGVLCLALEESPPPRQQIIASRSFGGLVTDLESLRQSVSTHAARAAEKLREDGSRAHLLTVFLHTPPFNPKEPQYHPQVTLRLKTPSRDTLTLTQAALRGLEAIYREGFRYQKAGVMLGEMTREERIQTDLFESEVAASRGERDRLLATMDRINRAMGRHTLWTASQGLTAKEQAEGNWRMNRGNLSPAYTTRWNEIPRVMAR